MRIDKDRIRRGCILVFCIITALGNVKTYMEGRAVGELGFTSSPVQEIVNTGSDMDSDSSAESSQPNFPEPLENTGGDTSLNDNGDTEAGRININTASEEELMTIKGIGQVKAKAIISYREKYGGFVALEEIMEVKGIGEGTFNKIKDLICLD